jgi:invasion protein IalB
MILQFKRPRSRAAARKAPIAASLLLAALAAAQPFQAQAQTQAQTQTQTQTQNQGQGQAQTQTGSKNSLDGAVFQDWRVRCAPDDAASGQAGICEAYQFIVDDKTQKAVLEIVVAYPPGKDNAVGAVIVPLGVLLPAGIAVAVDGKEIGKLPYQRCVPKGCVSQFVFTPEIYKSWQAGTKATVTVANGGGKEITLPVSLLGFTDATTAVKQ